MYTQRRTKGKKTCLFKKYLLLKVSEAESSEFLSISSSHEATQSRLPSQTTKTDCLSLLEKRRRKKTENRRLCFSELDVPKHDSITSGSHKVIDRLLIVKL